MAVYRPKKRSNTCFVALPFDATTQALFDRVIAPAARDQGLLAHHAGQAKGPRQIMQLVWESLWECSCMIAIVTGGNPNVNYELGMAHALAIPTLLVCEGVERDAPKKIPFDYRDHFVLWYDPRQSEWEERLRLAVVEALRELAQSGFRSVHALQWPYDNGASVGCERVYAALEHVPWGELVAGAEEITVAKLRLHVQEERFWFKAFEGVIKRGGKVTVCQADPLAPATLLRYFDERIQDRAGDVTIWRNGLQQLAENTQAMVGWRNQHLKSSEEATRFDIRLSPNYPTLALHYIRGDTWKRMLVFTYPFAERGYRSPVFQFSDPASAAFEFYYGCLQKVAAFSYPVNEDWIATVEAMTKKNHLSDEYVLHKGRVTGIIGRRKASVAWRGMETESNV